MLRRRLSTEQQRQLLLRVAITHEPVPRSLFGFASPDLFFSDDPARVVVVVEGLKPSLRQFLVADEHRRRPFPPIPVIEPTEDRPSLVQKTEMTEFTHEHGVAGLEMCHVVKRG